MPRKKKEEVIETEKDVEESDAGSSAESDEEDGDQKPEKEKKGFWNQIKEWFSTHLRREKKDD